MRCALSFSYITIFISMNIWWFSITFSLSFPSYSLFIIIATAHYSLRLVKTLVTSHFLPTLLRLLPYTITRQLTGLPIPHVADPTFDKIQNIVNCNCLDHTRFNMRHSVIAVLTATFSLVNAAPAWYVCASDLLMYILMGYTAPPIYRASARSSKEMLPPSSKKAFPRLSMKLLPLIGASIRSAA